MVALVGLWSALALGDSNPVREALFEWDSERHLLYLSLGFRDMVDSGVQSKLNRGLPVTLVVTAAIYRADGGEPLSTTAQTCKITWHVWEEAYRVEIARPGTSQVRWAPTAEGVLRRCAEARRLLAGDGSQIPEGVALYASGKIQVNPINPELLLRIRRWVMRPGSTGTAAQGDSLFSTFTGLFLQRVGEAEKQSKFVTAPMLPVLLPAESHEK
jgi:hypothetical protein